MSDHLQRHSKSISINRQPFNAKGIAVHTDPAFMEKLAHHKRSDVMYADFGKTRGREDNLVYHISDGYNLNRRREDETYMEQYLAI